MRYWILSTAIGFVLAAANMTKAQTPPAKETPPTRPQEQKSQVEEEAAGQAHGVVLEIVPRAGRVVDQAIGLLAVPEDSVHRQSLSRPSKSDSSARGLIRARNDASRQSGTIQLKIGEGDRLDRCPRRPADTPAAIDLAP